LGIKSVAVYSDADARMPYLEEADETFHIGPAPAQQSYLNQDTLLQAIKETKADAVHPGYGFLSESVDFASKIEQSGVAFIGPSSQWIREMSHKHQAKALMMKNGLSVDASSGVLTSNEKEIIAAGQRIGFPVLVKPSGGGGGIGMIPAHDEGSLVKAVSKAKALAERTFSNGDVYLEKLIERPRHIEFQMVADKHGNARHLFERECSIQRRYQKVIEESPAPLNSQMGMERIAAYSAQLESILKNIGYDHIGTVEMLLGKDQSFSFLEMNTRLQVEHGVTEEITGLDIVAIQIQVACGEKLNDILPVNISRQGHALEARIYAENPKNSFPSPGKLEIFRPPAIEGVRIDTGYAEGLEVTPYYDPLIAKVIVHQDTREASIQTMLEVLNDFEVSGIKTNISVLQKVFESKAFQIGDIHTDFLKDISIKNKTKK
jgi:acetyl-CoA carboxylase biotin carboxylase subunit